MAPTRARDPAPDGHGQAAPQVRGTMAAEEGPPATVSKFTFDMPHALVTLTDVDGDVEIEVWPKAGQSAYVVVPPPIARLIAERIVQMADAAEQAAPVPGDEVTDDPDPAPDTPDNVVDLASRRKPSRPKPSPPTSG